MNVRQQHTIAMLMQTVPMLKDHSTVLANMDMKEVVAIVKVC